MQKVRKNSRVHDIFGVFLPLGILVVGAFWLTLQFVQPAPPNRIVAAAATKGSPYYALAERYGKAMAANGVTLDILETAGSFENLKLLQTHDRNVEIGFLQGGVVPPSQTSGLRALGRVMYEPLWIFQNTAKPIERIADLRGRRVLVGPAGGGTNDLAMRILAANGISPETATLINMELPDYIKTLETGQADAGFLVLAANARTVQGLFASPHVRLLGLSQADAYAQRFPFLTRLDLKQGIVDFARNIPAADTPMVATMTSLVVRDDIHPALANLLTQAIVAVHAQPVTDPNGEVGVFDGSGVFPVQSDPQFRMADEARRVYRSGAPFFQQFLPFWLATLLDRMMLMAIPIFGLLLPALRFAPTLYNWRIRSRLLHWYQELKKIEDSGAVEAAQIRMKQVRVEEIEQAVDHMKLPLGYTNQLYDLRQHIDMVRRRLALKAVG